MEKTLSLEIDELYKRLNISSSDRFTQSEQKKIKTTLDTIIPSAFGISEYRLSNTTTEPEK